MRHRSDKGMILTEFAVDGKSNCFFQVMLEAIRTKNSTPLYSSEEAYAFLQEILTDMEASDKNKLNSEEKENADLEMVAWMRQVGRWAEEMAVRACADELECPIIVLSEDDKEIAKVGEEHLTDIDNRIWIKL